jgi:hypothetical protein
VVWFFDYIFALATVASNRALCIFVILHLYLLLLTNLKYPYSEITLTVDKTVASVIAKCSSEGTKENPSNLLAAK